MTAIKKLSIIIIPAILTLSGCANTGVGGADYTTSQVRGEQSVRLGTVESVREVRIQSDTPALAGTIGGGISGAALGSALGEGIGREASVALGALAGATAGNIAQNNMSTQKGVEITLRLDNGYVIAVTQGADEQFRVGERVQVLGGGGATRVTHLDASSPLK